MKEVDKNTYELIAEEIDTGNTQRALWTKAFSESEGDENKTKALYIKYRFDEVKSSDPIFNVESNSINHENYNQSEKDYVCSACSKPKANHEVLHGGERRFFCNELCYQSWCKKLNFSENNIKEGPGYSGGKNEIEKEDLEYKMKVLKKLRLPKSSETTSELVKDGNYFFGEESDRWLANGKDKISSQRTYNLEESSNSGNSISPPEGQTKKEGNLKADKIKSELKIGGFLHVVSLTLAFVTYKWTQIFYWEISQRRMEFDRPNLAMILLFLAILVNLYLLYKFFTKKNSFVTNFLWLTSLKLAVIIIYFNDKILEVEMLGRTISHSSPWPEAWFGVYLFYLVSAIYLLNSERVKNTFVH